MQTRETPLNGSGLKLLETALGEAGVATTNRRPADADVDSHDLAILSALSVDASQTMTELADRVHLSRSATVRRVAALRERGVLGPARAVIDYGQLGFSVHADVRLSAPTKVSFDLLDKVMARPEVITASIIAGGGLMIIETIAKDVKHLHRFLTWLQEHGDSDTRVILNTHRSKMPLRERLGKVDELLNTPDERLGY